MRIGFDAKRAFHNETGLGNYSRLLINSLAEYYPQNEYFLFNPKQNSRFAGRFRNVHEVKPVNLLERSFPSLWRSFLSKKEIKKLDLDIYHGLSNELPIGISKLKIKTVVTIHDLIFERYPELYPVIDRTIYRLKTTSACRAADKIIAASYVTKKDLVDFYGINEEKISVCYQSCDIAFSREYTALEKQVVRDRYSLPASYFLYVGSIIERKNLLTICKAYKISGVDLGIPLVVIGKGRKYGEKVIQFIRSNGLQQSVIFLSEKELISATDFALIYQMASALIYPSIFEGFGIPVLEAMFSKTPVITSAGTSMSEIAGNSAVYINPLDPNEIATAMKRISSNKTFADSLSAKGLTRAKEFTLQKCAESVMQVYKDLA